MKDGAGKTGTVLTERRRVLDGLLDKWGLERTWVSVLAAHVRGREHLAYIAAAEELSGAVKVESDMLDGLSVGEVGVLYEYSVARVDGSGRKERGQYFTPDDAAQFIVRQTAGFPAGVWLDPCCGVGNLAWHLVNMQDNPEEFFAGHLRCADVDPLALLVARVLLVASFQKSRSALFCEVADRFVVKDFLAEDVDGGGERRWNYVIMNPPYAATGRDGRFLSADARDLYAYFLERAATVGQGFVAVVPQSFTNAAKFRGLRKVLLDCGAGGLTVFTFDNVPGNFFKGYKFGSSNTNVTNSVRAAVVVKYPFVKAEGGMFPGGGNQVTSLLRWRGVERERLFREADLFLCEPGLGEDFFPKVSAPLVGLYRESRDWGVLSGLGVMSSVGEEGFCLYVPSVPRYFLCALKSPVARSSQRTLKFRTAGERDRAYLLLNSSLAYWWWRVRDGGMTLSLTTLLSVPVPAGFVADSVLIRELELSEKTNRVYKRNAGAVQENVKHPLGLVAQVNRVVVPEWADALLKTHENSEFVQLSSRKEQ